MAALMGHGKYTVMAAAPLYRCEHLQAGSQHLAQFLMLARFLSGLGAVSSDQSEPWPAHSIPGHPMGAGLGWLPGWPPLLN